MRFVKIGRDDYESYINLNAIDQLVRHTNGGNLPVPFPSSGFGNGNVNMVVPAAPHFDHFLILRGNDNRNSPAMMLTEEDYYRIVAALQAGGGEYLFEE